MQRLVDTYAENVPMGSLMYPSKVVRHGGKVGNYYLEDLMSFADDSDIFPAMVLPSSQKTFIKILTPSGVHVISKFALVAHERPR